MALFLVIMTDYVMLGKTKKKPDRIVNIDEKNEINSLHVNSRHDFI
jgi:hypothetical protein